LGSGHLYAPDQGLAHFLYTVWHTNRPQDMPNSRRALALRILEFLYKASKSLAA
jgi:hypothetical protein